MRYTAIADVSTRICNLLKEELVPEVIQKEDMIGVCTPDNHGEFVLGIYLYHIEQSDKFRLSGRENIAVYKQKHPPVVLDLHYMITPYYKSDVKFLANEEQIALGRVIQVIVDNEILMYDSGETVVLELENITVDDRQKIWTSNAPYRTSVFVSARAVIVESAKEKEIKRVTDFVVRTDRI